MKTKSVKWMTVLAFGCAMMFLPACSDEPMGSGDVEFEITDAPTDDANVDAVMVTVSDIKIDGQSVSGFSKQTINLKAYQNGETKLLGKAAQVNAHAYSNLTLVLDLDADANGNAPGCYVRTLDGTKYKLRSSASGTMDVMLTKMWSVRNNATTKLVMDFDLRKAISYSENAEVRYRFVSDNNLSAAVRVVEKDRSGNIEGSYEQDGGVDADMVVAYVYKKGTFNALIEAQAQGEDGIQFSHAVASANVKQTLAGYAYTFAFLDAGEYELHFANYNEDALTSKMIFDAMLDSETSVNGSINNIVNVQSGLTLSLSTHVTGEL